MRKVTGTPEQQAALAAAASGQPTPASQQTVENSVDAALGLNEEPESTPVKATAPSTAVATVAGNNAVATSAPNKYAVATAGALQGQWDESDFKYPQIKVVQGSGPLTEQFNVGTIILGEEAIMPPCEPKAEPTPIKVIPVSLRKRFQENVSPEQFAAGEMGQTVDTIEEVEALRGTTQWINQQKPSWSPTAVVTLLVEAPKGLEHPNFSLELDGKVYAVAIYYAKSSGYAGVAKAIFNALPLLNEEVGKDESGRPIKRPLLCKKAWTITWKRKTVNGYNIIAPTARLTTEVTGPEVREFCLSISGKQD